ncbi:hypothetical protein DICVIV_02478 [Dictyocaulus viviparus]|uniref:RRM domain-containing protein n=1 Tax=Dictyocaulus viviparus TaxID=29172 RepID=A0A0D8Y5U8_DICVI|nr:hypothetical protein DICVIV_02478 [Dictyocaulus viviparus]
MSVNNSSDSGGGGGADVAYTNPTSLTDMGAMGSWAEIMAEEQVESTTPSEKQGENQICDENSQDTHENLRKPQEQQHFAVQVTNLPDCTDEELYYYFGGEDYVSCAEILRDRPYAARVDFFTIEGIKRAKQLDGKKFRDRSLRVYEMRDDRIRERPPHEFHNRQYNNEPASYHRENTRYNSQSSLYGSDSRNIDRNGRPYNTSNDYRNNAPNRSSPMSGTFSRGKYYNCYDDYNNGRFASRGQTYRGNGQYYQNAPHGSGTLPPRSRGTQVRGGYGGGRGNTYGNQELSRSDSYNHGERDKNALMTRSRTESTSFNPDRRRALLSRTSSRLSTSTEEVDAPMPRVKKLTNKDIFGEAKPVDTSERLREIEAKQERERLLEQQKYKEEAEAARLALSAEAEDGTAPQQHQHGTHVTHHAPSHQYQHASSRPLVPPHSHHNYGLYQSTHGMPQHSQQSLPSSSQFHQQYDGSGTTNYRIMRRDSAEPTDSSPPLDPVHAKLPVDSQNKSSNDAQDTVDGTPTIAQSGNTTTTSGRLDSCVDRRQVNDVNVITGAETLPRSGPKHRVYCNPKYVSTPLQKSATMDEIRETANSHRGRGRGGRVGRGFTRGGTAADRRSSFSGVEKLPAAPPSSRKPAGEELEDVQRRQSTEDHQVPHVSFRGGRMGTLRKNRGGNGYIQDRALREQRGENGSWSGYKGAEGDTRKEQSKLPEERVQRQEESEEKAATPPIKNDGVKISSSANSQLAITSSNTSIQERKKEKKKTNKKETAKGGKTLNNNKFALLVDSED